MLKQMEDADFLVSDVFLQNVKMSNITQGGKDLRFVCSNI